MAFTALGAYACKVLQASLTDYYQQNQPAFRTLGSVGLLKWLMSPQNTRGFKQIDVESIPGKKRGVAFLVDNPFCFEVCSLHADCNSVRIAGNNPSQEIVFSLDGPEYRVCQEESPQSGVMNLTFSEDDLARYCTVTDYSYITAQIARYNKRFIEQLDQRLFEIAALKVGTNGAGAALSQYKFFTANSTTLQSNINAMAVFQLEQGFKDAGNDGQFAIVGGQIANMISAFKNWQGLNAMGVDLNNLNEELPYVYYDRNSDRTLGLTDFLQIAPGAMQFVTWNKFKGEKRRAVTDFYTHSTFIDPATGIEVDFEWYYDPKCQSWTYEPFLYAELAVSLAGGCSVALGGPGAGVNGVIRVHDCSAVSAASCP